jgi:hypothetical protein
MPPLDLLGLKRRFGDLAFDVLGCFQCRTASRLAQPSGVSGMTGELKAAGPKTGRW